MGTENIYKGNKKILFLTTFAFFLTFVVWFNMAPFTTTIMKTLGLSKEQVGILMSFNVALTIPARMIIGLLVDRFGPRKVYSALLSIMSIPCFLFAFGNTFWQLFISRLFLGIIGAGFVIGIRMVSEWFPERQIGLAEGIYGGWGNFGSAAAAFSLPLIALWIGGENGWRYAVILTGAVSFIYGFVYFFTVQDTPKRNVFKRAKRGGTMDVTSPRDMLGLMIMTFPVYGILGVLTWKLAATSLISTNVAAIIYAILAIFYLVNLTNIWTNNKDIFNKDISESEKYSFRQVAILDLAYMITFGSELAVVSMLPMFFQTTFHLSVVQAGMISSSFAFTNLVARPCGGLLSDRFGRKKSLMIALICICISFLGMSMITSKWPLIFALLLTIVCSVFVQAGSGAVFSFVPLIKKQITGQVSGMVGAFGNIGGVAFLTILSFVSFSIFFLVIGIVALACFTAALFLKEPSYSEQHGYSPIGNKSGLQVGSARGFDQA
jgi:NNP family nitrate/nitrite transporter-like MFS transporter